MRNADGEVFVGKHADGPFKGKWGVPSIDASVDRRPQRVAQRLLETSLIGMLGTRNHVSVKKLTSSALGLQMYEATTHVADLPLFVQNTCEFVASCFAAGASVPAGLIPWTACKWHKIDEKLQGADPFTVDALTNLQSIANHMS